MYLEFFGLRDFPFRLTPDTEFLFMSNAHVRAKAYMDYSIWNREGFVVITGEIGCGKTTLIKKLLTELDDENVVVAKVFQTQLDDVEFLQAMLVEFGLNPFSAKKVELIDMLNTFLVDNFLRQKQIVLVVDDAHNLNMRVLEEIRLLSGLETQKEKILHVILVGQPQLNEMLETPELEQLLQRVRLRYHLKALSQEDTAEYIAHRLRVAGRETSDLFQSDTIPLIYKYTGGIPRLINTLCDTAMTCAYADDVATIGTETINEAINELQWQPYAKRTSSTRTKSTGSKVTGIQANNVERERLVNNIGNRLNQLDTLSPAMSLMADRMASIETLLRDIAELLRDRSQEPAQEIRRAARREK
jgi:type II secretory pathway predicted ATPase ExeA